MKLVGSSMNEFFLNRLNTRTLNKLRAIKWMLIGSVQRPFLENLTFRKYEKFYIREASLKILAEILEPGAVAVDAGSNIGAYSYNLSRLVSGSGMVFAFEPRTDVYRLSVRMMEKLGISNVVIENVGLSDSPGLASLYLPPSHGRSALFPFPDLDGVGMEQVNLVTLDEYLKTRQLPRLDFIKIDVEGHETDVILGARESIDNHKPLIYVEVEERHLMPQGRSVRGFCDLMREIGYAGYGLYQHRLQPIDEMLEGSHLASDLPVDLPIANFWFLPETRKDYFLSKISVVSASISAAKSAR